MWMLAMQQVGSIDTDESTSVQSWRWVVTSQVVELAY